MFSTFDLRLLLYVIRLAGWLKHCNLSLSLSLTHDLTLCVLNAMCVRNPINWANVSQHACICHVACKRDNTLAGYQCSGM